MNSKTLVETANEYLQEHKTKKGESASAQELNRFVRWYGGHNRASALTPLDIEKYVEYTARSTGDLSARMEPVKDFLNHLHESGMTDHKLSSHLKYKRSGSKSSDPRKDKGVNYLTKEGHQKLKAEHEELVKQRVSVADDLKKAMADKDFRENAPLDAARDRQAHLEARIRELEAILKRAEIMTEGSSKNATGRVRLGSRVSIKDLSDNEVLAYTLVSSSEANLRESRISIDSPIGSAIYDKRPGEHVEVKAPAGIQRYVIEKVEP